MTFLMYYKFSFLYERLIIIDALQWFLSSISLHMAHKSTILWESLVTLATLKVSQVCVQVWVIWLVLCERTLSQWIHWNTFFSMYFFIWLKRFLLCEKASLHSLYLIFFLTDHLYMVHKITTLWKSLSHWFHWNGFSPMWLLIWVLRCIVK